MKISELELTNFRCFKSLSLKLDPQCTILVGINGAGKSTILDALAVALGGYIAGFESIHGVHIHQEDSRYETNTAGSRIDTQPQFPVVVRAFGEVAGREIGWQRELSGLGRRTTHGNAKRVIDIARSFQDRIRKGDSDCILPLVAYYGTARLWMQKKNRTISFKSDKKLSRQTGYIDCLNIASNEKQMMQWFEEMTYIQLQEGAKVPELEAVKKALKRCYLSVDSAITDAEFSYNVKSKDLEITLHRDKEVSRLPVKMLSDGEKGIISLVADIAYRMALLNPDLLDRVLEAPGVVLIDEIDMHLHPSWQKKIIVDLMEIFPNIQFVVTTHSPSVLANVEKEHIRVLDHYQLYDSPSTTYGRSTEEILREIMYTEVRPEKVLNLKSAFDSAIDNEDFTAAQNLLDEMKHILGENSKDVVESQVTLNIEREFA